MSKKHWKNPETGMKPFLHENHKKPVTRRDFLGQGLIAGSATVMAPSLFTLLGLSNQATAAVAALPANVEDCGASVGGGVGKIPFIAYDLGGGASIAGSNVIVGGPGGPLQDFLDVSGYEKQGLPGDMIPSLPNQVNTDLGLAFHADSAMLAGILSKISAGNQTLLVNVNGCVICAESNDDTGNNPHNPMFGISKAGAAGDLLPLIGNRSSDSGGKSRAPDSMFDISLKPTKIASASDARGIVDTGKLTTLLPNILNRNPQDAELVMKVIEQVSAKKVGNISEPQLIQDLVQCGYLQSAEAITQFSDPATLDPNNDAFLPTIFPGGDLGNSEYMRAAAVIKLVLGQTVASTNYVGAGTINWGSFDYHDGSRTTGETRDRKIGEAIGAALEYAMQTSQKVMLYVFSDGSVSSRGAPDGGANGKLVWNSDNGSTAATFFLVYDPNGQPVLRRPEAQQIGYFNTNGSVETLATAVSKNVSALSEMIVLNYLAIHGEEGRLDEIIPNNSLGSTSERDSLMVFEPFA